MVTPGVTTRLQREQQMRQEVQTTSYGTRESLSSASIMTSASSSSVVTTASSVSETSLSSAQASQPQTNETTSTVSSATTSSATVSSATTATLPTVPDTGVAVGDQKAPATSSVGSLAVVVSDTTENDEEEENHISTTSNASGTGGPHPCVVCKAVLEHHGQSRPLPKHQSAQYGMQVGRSFDPNVLSPS